MSAQIIELASDRKKLKSLVGVDFVLLQYKLKDYKVLVWCAGTITQLFRAGESECSVIMLWTYGLASISLTLWSTVFMWLVG